MNDTCVQVNKDCVNSIESDQKLEKNPLGMDKVLITHAELMKLKSLERELAYFKERRQQLNSRLFKTESTPFQGETFGLEPELILVGQKRDNCTGLPFLYVKMSPDLASKVILENGQFARTGDDSNSPLWWYDKEVWNPNGEKAIQAALDAVAKDHSTISRIKETLRRVRNNSPMIKFDCYPYLLGCKNNVINLATGEVTNYRPDYYISQDMMIPVTYDPAAKCPQILKFLLSTVPDLDQTLTLVDIITSGAILEAMTYIALLLGLGSNGKGVYEKLIGIFYGEDSIEAISLAELASNEYATAELARMRFNISSEENNDEKATEIAKKISTGDRTSSNVKFQQRRLRFTPFTKLLSDTNKPPIFTDNSYGFIRRFKKIDFPYSFKDHPDPNNPLEKQKDPDLLQKITHPEELSGLLNLVIYRAPTLIRKKDIHRVGNDMQAYRKQSKSASAFIDEFLEVHPDHSSTWKVSSEDLWTKFEEWRTYAIAAELSGITALSTIIHAKTGIAPGTIRLKDDPKTQKGFNGIRFKEDEFKAFIQTRKKFLSDCDGSVTGKNDKRDVCDACDVCDGQNNFVPHEAIKILQEIVRLYGDEECQKMLDSRISAYLHP